MVLTTLLAVALRKNCSQLVIRLANPNVEKFAGIKFGVPPRETVFKEFNYCYHENWTEPCITYLPELSLTNINHSFNKHIKKYKNQKYRKGKINLKQLW